VRLWRNEFLSNGAKAFACARAATGTPIFHGFAVFNLQGDFGPHLTVRSDPRRVLCTRRPAQRFGPHL
jgi:hypothetical protein